MSSQDEWVSEALAVALNQIEKGDKKYGPHPGMRRGLGALKNELQELETEIYAEDEDMDGIALEVLQVIGMGFKFYRDCVVGLRKEKEDQLHHILYGEKKTSAEWVEEMKPYHILINDPAGWRIERVSFYTAFNVEKINLASFLLRLSFSNYEVGEEWMKRYAQLMTEACAAEEVEHDIIDVTSMGVKPTFINGETRTTPKDEA